MKNKGIHLKRESYYKIANENGKSGQQLGYDYRGKLYEKTVSPLILKEEKRKGMIQKLDDMVTFLIEAVKNIKKTYVYSLSKTSQDIN